jgi:hypothetical protein
MNETRLEKIGMADAMMYATAMQVNVQPSHVAQCTSELLVRCVEPRRIRTKTYLAGS